MSYSQLTHTVLHHQGPRRSRLLRINLSSLAVSHIMPGGTAPGTAVAYRLLTQSGVPGADAGFALAMQGVGSALVLNSILWSALLVSVFLHGYNPLYAVGAGAGVVLMGLFAGVVLALTRGRNRSIEIIRRWAAHVPFLDGDKVAVQLHRVAELSAASSWPSASCSRGPCGGRRRSGCSTRRRCSCSSRRWGRSSPPSTCWSPMAWRRSSPSSPSHPSGLGVIEGVLIPTLVSFGVPKETAILGVLGYRLVNFWLPIPVGGIAYLSLRFSGEGWGRALAPRARRGGVPRRRHASGAAPTALSPEG